MHLTFRAVSEPQPGPVWAGLFKGYWPAYRKWWAREGLAARPPHAECLRALKTHMPEIVGLYEDLCVLAGDDPDAARFLSFSTPPAYLAGCSQAIWPGEAPLLVRNYDYDPKATDAVLLHSGWQGRGVIGMTDGLFGLIDGMNDAGLAVSLTFGGRPEVGKGFGVPLILRYILQTCETAAEAGAALKRIPSHMSYNVTVLDRGRNYLTAYLAPDRDTILTRAAVATNHQERVEWIGHARMTATVERERFLLQRITLHVEPAEKFIAAFLRPPLYSTAFNRGFGTLYTAAYRLRTGTVDIHWPGSVWPQGFADFRPGTRRILVPAGG